MRTAKTLSDWAHAQGDLSLRWAHTHFVGFVMSRLIFVGCAHHMLLVVTKHFIVVHVQPWYSSDHKHAQIISMHINTEEIRIHI